MRRMNRASVLLLVVGGLALWPAGAGANTTVAPANLSFAAQAVGTTSASQPVTLTKDCQGTDSTFCASPGYTTFNTSISVSGPFSQTNNCPGALLATFLTGPVS